MNIYSNEKKLIELIYLGNNNYEEISSILNITEKKVIKMKKNIFRKLQVNNWFNAIRKSFEYNILPKSKYRSLDINLELENTINSIKNMKDYKSKSDSEIKLKIFYKLVKLYSMREYDILLRQFDINDELYNKFTHKNVS